MPERLTKSCTKLSYNRLYQKHLGLPKEEDETCLILYPGSRSPIRPLTSFVSKFLFAIQ